jgi:hypothetical protein
LKAKGRTRSGRINPLASTEVSLKVNKETGNKNYDKTEGISVVENTRRKAAGECLRCAWPPDRKGNHRVKDCVRPLKTESGTASYPKGRKYHNPEFSDSEDSAIDSKEDKE